MPRTSLLEQAQATQNIGDVRAFVQRHPNSGLAVAWGQMLEDIDAFGDEYSMDDFHEEADIQAAKGNCY